MRPIDADKLKDFCAQWMANEKDPEKKRARKIRNELFNTFIDWQETVDAVPIVHGEWIDFTMEEEEKVPKELCGNCGKWSYGIAKNYCPHCGADNRYEFKPENND